MHAIDVVETHISEVFLVGDDVYKRKKPVNLGFLDFTTLSAREHFCREEVRLNRRLARDVYYGVVPIRRAGHIEDWVVWMRRLPAEDTLESRLRAGRLKPRHLEEVAAVMADFHLRADRSPVIASGGRLETVARNCAENFEQTQASDSPVWDRVRDLTARALERLGPLVEARANRGVPCDSHGDLRLGHVYLLGSGVTIIDCIEFAPRFRHADPVADIAFLAMELRAEGRPDLSTVFIDAWFAQSGDQDGRALLEFYVAYRSVVRAKVRQFEAATPGVASAQRARALLRARGHWLLALATLEAPERRPALVVFCGLPGTGKSTLAMRLGEDCALEVVRTDAVRQRLGSSDYSDAGKAEVDAAVLEEIGAKLDRGGRVIVDAGLWTRARRAPFLHAARSRMLPLALIPCDADADTVRTRLASRTGDASDADWTVYEAAHRLWESPGVTAIRTDTDDGGMAAARARLTEIGVVGPPA
jgi:uncharacterized protein